MTQRMRLQILNSRSKGLRGSSPLSDPGFTKGILRALLVAAVGCLLASCVSGSSTRFAEIEEGAFTPMIKDITMLKVGDKAPMFEVSDVRGNRLKLSDRIGKNVIVLVFWSVYCEPCKSSMPAYNDIYRRYHRKGLDFYAVNMDGAEMSNAIRAFVEQENIQLTVLLDEPEGDSLRIADPYGVQGTPTIYVIDKGGRIVFSKAGTVTYEELSSVVKKELRKNE
ncbi:TlpA family protein disulfide reductase [Candidatus Poribacteria bacterium]|nr:TlpA family protein disulfide reductase [Candidatus Poribacteria bacterium]